MLRLFGWMVAGGFLLGAASMATAQDSQTGGYPATGNVGSSQAPGVGYGYSGGNAYGDLVARGLGYSTIPGVPVAGLTYGLGDGHTVPVIGDHKSCFTPYPLRAIYPYSYTGPGSAFGAYSFVPYPYAPVGYGWYGEFWRGW